MSDARPAGVNDQQAIVEEAAPKTKTEQEQQKAAAEFSQLDSSGKPQMRVQVYSPFRDYYDGPAFSLTAENPTGPFDILPKHHNFISLLSPCELVIRSVQDGDQHINISGGLMHVKADHVIVFLDV